MIQQSTRYWPHHSGWSIYSIYRYIICFLYIERLILYRYFSIYIYPWYLDLYIFTRHETFINFHEFLKILFSGRKNSSWVWHHFTAPRIRNGNERRHKKGCVRPLRKNASLGGVFWDICVSLVFTPFFPWKRSNFEITCFGQWVGVHQPPTRFFSVFCFIQANGMNWTKGSWEPSGGFQVTLRYRLGGGFKYFSKGLKPPTRKMYD